MRRWLALIRPTAMSLVLLGILAALVFLLVSQHAARPPSADKLAGEAEALPMDNERELIELTKARREELRREHEARFGPQAPPARSTAEAPIPGLPASEFTLPGRVRDVDGGGGGRYLLLSLARPSELAVFDLEAGAIVRRLALRSEDAMVAAGSERFVVITPDPGLIERWSFDTSEVERTAALPFDGRVRAVSMGGSSDGPVLVHWSTGVSAGYFNLIDLETLLPLRGFAPPFPGLNLEHPRAEATGSIVGQRGNGPLDVVRVRSSLDGATFAIWETRLSPSGLQTIAWDGRALRGRYEHVDVEFAAPSPDGKRFFGGRARLFDEGLQPTVLAPQEPPLFLPSHQPELLVGLRGSRGTYVASLHLAGDRRLIASLGGLPELGPADEPRDPDALDLDLRVHLLPAAGLLATIPPAADRIFLRRVDVRGAVESSGADYLLVASAPDRRAERGRAYEYKPIVWSSKPGARVALSSGPRGMEMTSDGRVRWDVPGDFVEPSVPVVLSVGDAARPIFHEYTIQIR